MEPKTIESISNQVYRRFPEFTGVKPNVRKQPKPKSEGLSKISPDSENYLLTYKKDAKGPGGQIIPRCVRVVATPKGKIVKITTSK
jgi:hypothetical protein